MFRCETTALFTSRSSRNRSRSRASSRLRRTGALVVQDVVDRDRDLLGHFLHERDFAVVVFVLLQRLPNPIAPRRPSAVVKGTAQNDCTPFSRKRGMHGSEPVLECDVVDDQRLLRLPDEAARRLVDGELGAWLDRRVDRRGKQVQPHDVAVRIVQHQVDVVERDDPREPLGEIVKEFVQVRM